MKRDASADQRLLTTRWHNDAAEAAIDPDRDGNQFSFYYRSRLDIRRAGGGRFKCEDIRSRLRRACRRTTAWNGSYSYLDVANSPDVGRRLAFDTFASACITQWPRGREQG